MNGWMYIFAENFVLLHASMAGKWFAETAFDAAQWGRLFYQWSGTPFYVIKVDVPDWVTAQMFRVANLDNIGTARWASEGDLLDPLNPSNLPAILSSSCSISVLCRF